MCGVGWAQEAVGSPTRGRVLAAPTGLGSVKGMASGKRGWEPLVSASLSHVCSTAAGSMELGWCEGEPV